MDSFTQFVLGAAVGEAVLGKKIGNRAMLWGGIAGTIPDLDVLAGVVADDVTALAFHRGITHSISFAILAPAAFAYLCSRYYKQTTFAMSALITVLFAFVMVWFPAELFGKMNWFLLIASISLGGTIIFFTWKKLYPSPYKVANADFKSWYKLFFWAILTHPLLDCCTTYGTQIFQPFSDYRVAFCNVSVADPIYTVPFLLCLIIAWVLSRNKQIRTWINWAGIIWGCAYLLFGFYNKMKVDDIFEHAMRNQGIEWARYTTGPSIFTNFLWNCTVETDSAFYLSTHSLYEKEAPSFRRMEKGHQLLSEYENHDDIKTLKWFSKNYYNVIIREDGKLQINDLRYGNIDERAREEDAYVFRFILHEEADGNLAIEESRGARNVNGEMWNAYWDKVYARD